MRVEDLGWGHREPDAAALEERPGAHHDLAVLAARVESVQSHRPRGRRAKAQEGLDRGGLARAVGAQQRDDLAVGDVQAEVRDGHDVAELDAQAGDLDGVAHDHRTYRARGAPR